MTRRDILAALTAGLVWALGLGAAIISEADTVSYTYDSLGRLKQAASDNGAVFGNDPGAVFDYAYDSAGNRASAHTEMTAPRQRDLMAYYPFEEGEASSTADASGRGHDGTLMNAVSWTTDGINGNALAFDGDNDYVVAPAHADLSLTETFTLIVWFNTPTINTGMLICHDGGEGQDPNGSYQLSLGTSKLVYANNNLGGGLTATVTLTPDVWHQAIVTYDADAVPRMRIYVDGSERAVSTADNLTPWPNVRAVLIGRRGWDTTQQFTGMLDEIRLYKRPLSADEVAASYRALTDPWSYLLWTQ